MAAKSMTVWLSLSTVLTSALDRASAALLSAPLMCLMSVVNWEMNSR